MICKIIILNIIDKKIFFWTKAIMEKFLSLYLPCLIVASKSMTWNLSTVQPAAITGPKIRVVCYTAHLIHTPKYF